FASMLFVARRWESVQVRSSTSVGLGAIRARPPLVGSFPVWSPIFGGVRGRDRTDGGMRTPASRSGRSDILGRRSNLRSGYQRPVRDGSTRRALRDGDVRTGDGRGGGGGTRHLATASASGLF